jgi:retron-type reverse transcriptase
MGVVCIAAHLYHAWEEVRSNRESSGIDGVELHVQEKWTLSYIRRLPTVPYKTPDGKETERTCSVPQSLVVGPLLANMYLHYSFDKWMEQHYPHILFEHCADDVVCHYRSENEALELREALES